MAKVSHLLILGGTAEALTLAKAASSLAGLDVVTSLAGRTAAPQRPDGELRIGGFGGVTGLARYLGEAKIDLVIDATHPFATVITAHAWNACKQRGVAFLRLLRPPWTPRPGARWIDVDDAAEAARALPARAQRVFLAIGKKDIAAFAGLSDRWFLFRSVDPLAGSLPFAGLAIIDRGPFHSAAEQALLSAHRIDAVVSRNSGGEGSAAKLEAARALDLPVVMIRRPATLDAPMVHTVDDAVLWLRRHLV